MANNGHVLMISSPAPPTNSPELAEGRNGYSNASPLSDHPRCLQMFLFIQGITNGLSFSALYEASAKDSPREFVTGSLHMLEEDDFSGLHYHKGRQQQVLHSISLIELSMTLLLWFCHHSRAHELMDE